MKQGRLFLGIFVAILVASFIKTISNTYVSVEMVHFFDFVFQQYNSDHLSNCLFLSSWCRKVCMVYASFWYHPFVTSSKVGIVANYKIFSPDLFITTYDGKTVSLSSP